MRIAANMANMTKQGDGQIRLATVAERSQLLDVWLQSVNATHSFVTPSDIDAMIPHVRDYLHSDSTVFWVYCAEDGVIAGFMGLAADEMESLFIAPEHQRKGIGRQLVDHALASCPDLFVEVNEQNHAARAFYEACGFDVVGRSEKDRQGRDYPLLRLKHRRSFF